ncbi:hypothetical protein ACH5RR_020118 [Cinchona calisaya]|uniref:PPM-type phosphatase domain-containing protein n=1 Tax=Cinchona calisaya TaxID=153742 RepID=A0ABD2ZDH9_9GENT
MEGSKITLVNVLAVILSFFAVVMCCSSSTHEVSVACMMAYDKGGAPSVFSSQECPQWEWTHPIQVPQYHPTANCEFASATFQGRRHYQEDRISCNPAMKIPLLGNEGQEITIGVAAVFDGHLGAEASELASKKFLDYFYLNVLFNTYKQALPHKKHNDEANHHVTTVESTPLYDILKEALTRTFGDIDSEFTQEALKNNYAAGSTGTVAVLVNNRILVGFVGDSKALLCSDTGRASEGVKVRAPNVEELTRDHHPDREDERARMEAWGMPHVSAQLAVSRAIGNLNSRRYGVIPEAEVIGWRTQTSNNSFLVLGSDGIFEGLTPANVCAILHNNGCKSGTAASSSSSSCLAMSALANRIVNSAFENGSNDNLSIVVIPLNPTYSF